MFVLLHKGDVTRVEMREESVSGVLANLWRRPFFFVFVFHCRSDWLLISFLFFAELKMERQLTSLVSSSTNIFPTNRWSWSSVDCRWLLINGQFSGTLAELSDLVNFLRLWAPQVSPCSFVRPFFSCTQEFNPDLNC